MNIKDKTRFLLNMGEENIHQKIIEEVEDQMIDAALIHFYGNQSEVSRKLGISRTTLKHKLIRAKEKKTALANG
jgi:DNA-binding NtrC family response regulator